MGRQRDALLKEKHELQGVPLSMSDRHLLEITAHRARNMGHPVHIYKEHKPRI